MSDCPEMHWDADAGQWVPSASQPRHSATAILALAAPAFALPQTAVIPGMRGMAQSLHTGTGVRSSGSRRLSPSLSSARGITAPSAPPRWWRQNRPGPAADDLGE
jgi:hypothetical protein